MAQVVGLDIGTSAVRAAELEFGSGAPVLVAFGQVGLPPGAIVDGEVQDLSAVSDAIMRLWQNGKFQSKSVVVGIAGLRAITREVDLPWVPDEDIDSAVRFQSEEVIPFPPDKTILSAQVLSDNTAPDGTKTRRVSGRRRPSRPGRRRRERGRECGPRRRRCRPRLFRVWCGRWATPRSRPSAPRRSCPSAPASPSWSSIKVAVPSSSGPSAPGGNAATAAVASALDLPLVDAEGIKRRLGEASPQVQSAESAVQPAIAELVGEIRNSVQYFATLPGSRPDRPGPSHRWRRPPAGSGQGAAGPGPHPRRARLALGPPRPVEDRPRSRAGGQHRARAGHAHRSGASRAQPVGEEVQSGPARDHPTCLRASGGPQGVRGRRRGRGPAGGGERRGGSCRSTAPRTASAISTAVVAEPQCADPQVRQGRRHQQRAPGGQGPGRAAWRAPPSTGRRWSPSSAAASRRG